MFHRNPADYEKIMYKYMELVDFIIFKSESKYTHYFREFLVFFGDEYSSDDGILMKFKLIDILTLMFVYYKNDLPGFVQILHSIQDRNQLSYMADMEYLSEIVKQRDNYVEYLQNERVNGSSSIKKWRERIIENRIVFFTKYLKTWRTNGYVFYNIKNEDCKYIPYQVKSLKDKICVDPSKSGFLFHKYASCCANTLHKNLCNKKKNMWPIILKNIPMALTRNRVISLNAPIKKIDSSKEKMMQQKKEESFTKEESSEETDSEETKDRRLLKIKNNAFQDGNPLSVISLMNAMEMFKDNDLVNALYEKLVNMGITNFEDLFRFTNISGILLAYDVFDELFLQIRLLREYYSLDHFSKSGHKFPCKMRHISKKDLHRMKEDKNVFKGLEKKELFNKMIHFKAPTCLTAYCKLNTVWKQNTEIEINVKNPQEKNTLNFMTIGDIGQGFADIQTEQNGFINFLSNINGSNKIESVSKYMKEWNFNNDGDFIINLGDNVPVNQKEIFTSRDKWLHYMKDLFVFRKRRKGETECNKEKDYINKEKISCVFRENLHEFDNLVYIDRKSPLINYGVLNQEGREEIKEDKNKKAEQQINYTEKEEEQNTEVKTESPKRSEPISIENQAFNFAKDFVRNNALREAEININETVPFYSILGEKDYFYSPSQQIQEHYSSNIPGFFMPNNYYSVTYNVTSNVKTESGEISTETFKATFVYIDTWALMIGFPIKRNFRQYAEQYNWLNETLKKSAKESDWIFVVGHHPLFSSGRRSDDISFDEHFLNSTLRKLFDYYKIDAYFSAHDHLLEFLEYRNINLFVNGASSIVLFDDSVLGKGLIGSTFGRFYSVFCYVSGKIRRSLTPKGCRISSFSKWYSKAHTGFTTHKLSKDTLTSEFIGGINGTPLRKPIVFQNRKWERALFYNYHEYVNRVISSTEKLAESFSKKNEKLSKFKIDYTKKQIEEYAKILQTIKLEKHRNLFYKLAIYNFEEKPFSKYLQEESIEDLKIMHSFIQEYPENYNSYVKESLKHALEFAEKEQKKKEQKKKTENSEIINNKSNVDDEETLKKIEKVLKNAGITISNFVSMVSDFTPEQMDILKQQLGFNVDIEDYIEKLKEYDQKQKANKEDTKKKEKSKETDPKIEKANKKWLSKIEKLSDNEKTYLNLYALKMVNPTYYNYALKLEGIKVDMALRSYQIENINPRKSFIQLNGDLASEVKRTIHQLGGTVGKKKIYFDIINTLFTEIVRLKEDLHTIALKKDTENNIF